MNRPSRATTFAVIAVLVAAGALLVQRLSPGSFRILQTDVRRDLFLDQEHVHLLEGFGEWKALPFVNDYLEGEPDRDEIMVPVARTCRLRWDVDARAGRFVARVGRLQVGGLPDASACRLRVTALQDGEPLPGVSLEVSVPAVPRAPDAPQAKWHEGPAVDVELALPRGAGALEIALASSGGVPDGSAVALYSPRVLQQPLVVPGSRHELEFEQATRLTTVLDVPEAAPVVFAQRRAEGAVDGEQTVSLPPVEEVGAFTGRTRRHALAFTGEAELGGIVDIPRGSALEAELALDDRLPEGTIARLEVSVDDTLLTAIEVDSVHWQPLRVDLDGVAGHERELRLRTRVVRLEPAEVGRAEPDFVTGASVPTAWVARTVRLGVADPRIARPVHVPGRLSSPTQPSVLVVHVETLRADLFLPFRQDVAAAAGPQEREALRGALQERWGVDLFTFAPNLTALAERSRVYTRAIAPSPWTLPSTATLLTGLFPSAHGVVDHDREVIPDGVPTLAERAREAGVATGAVIANDLLRPGCGFARGFQTYAYVPRANARQMGDLARSFLDDHKGQQFLLLLHYWDPHGPYDAPEPWRERYVPEALRGRDRQAIEEDLVRELRRGESRTPDDPDVRFLVGRYLGEVAWFDDQLGKLLDHLAETGLAKTTTLILTADHGEEFYEHGLFGHGSDLYAETVHVPLLIADPAALASWGKTAPAQGSDVDTVVSTAGLCAEILTRLAVPFEAEELRPPLEQGAGWAFTETEKGQALEGEDDILRRPLRATWDDAGLLVVERALPDAGLEQRTLFYDLLADPDAQTPLPADGPAAQVLLQRLEEATRWADAHRARGPAAGGDQASLEQPQALGYVGASDPSRDDD